jgi:hypothetical protein
MDCNLDVVRGLGASLILTEVQTMRLQDQRGQTNGSPLGTWISNAKLKIVTEILI